MRGKYIFAKRAALLLAILSILLTYINIVLMPKYYYQDIWPTTFTYMDFYELENNSVDVIFLGSSNAAAGFIPQELYNNYGIGSYNLGCEQQSMLISYFWLKESLKYQHPQVVILDCLMLFPFNDMGALNESEECIRKALDYMRLGKVKSEAIEAVCNLDENQSKMSFYLSNIRYHSRWKEISRQDFLINEAAASESLYGYTPLFDKGKNTSWSPFEDCGVIEGGHQTHPVMEEYFFKIVSLCKEQDIELIMVKTPTTDEYIGKYNRLKVIAEAQGLTFLDFNEKSIFEQTDFIYAEDMNDDAHCNIQGASKLTNFLGKYFIEEKEYDPHGKYNEQWEKTKRFYEETYYDFKVHQEKNIDTYLELLEKKDYIIFATAEALNGKKRACYYINNVESIINITEGNGNEIKSEGQFLKGRYHYYMEMDKDTVKSSMIKIDDREYESSGFDAHIVVYSNSVDRVIDARAFHFNAER